MNTHSFPQRFHLFIFGGGGRVPVTRYYQLNLLLYGFLYPLWAAISYFLITDNEPYWERIILGAALVATAFSVDWIYKKLGSFFVAAAYHLVVFLAIFNYFTIVMRAESWGDRVFIAYCVGYFLVILPTAFVGRTLKEVVLWVIYTAIFTIAIAMRVDFMNPVVYLLMILTINLVVGTIGYFTHYLLAIVQREQKINLFHSKLATIGNMTTAISHEINNSLSVISGSVELIELKSGKQHEDLLPIRKSADRMAKILRTLQRVSPRKAGDSPTTHQQIDLGQEISEIAEIYTPQFREFEIDFSFVRQSSKPVMVSVGEDVSQILLNLLNNALYEAKQHENRFIKVTLAKTNEHAVVSIENSGAVIAEEMKERIFEPFFSTKPNALGSGLGLSICKSMILREKGDLRLDSSVPHPKFDILIPLSSELQRSAEPCVT